MRIYVECYCENQIDDQMYEVELRAMCVCDRQRDKTASTEIMKDRKAKKHSTYI